MRKHGIIALIIGLTVHHASQAEQGQRVADVYILSGQSNMEGQGKISELPPTYAAPIEGAFYWNGDTFEPFNPQHTRLSKKASDFGPELSFTHTIKQLFPDRDLYIIKTYASGQGLHHGWDGARWNDGEPAPNRRTFYPGQDANNPHAGVHYQELRNTFNAALAALNEQHIPYRIAGFVWVQGGQDAKNKTSATAYAQNLRLLKNRVQEDLGIDHMPLVFEQSGPGTTIISLFSATNQALLRASQARADWRSGSEEAIPHAWMVACEGMALNPDMIHYNTTGQLLLGQSLALSMIQAHEVKRWFDEREALSNEATRILDARKQRWAERRKQQAEKERQDVPKHHE